MPMKRIFMAPAPINDGKIPELCIFMCGSRCRLDAIEPAPVKLYEGGGAVMRI